MVPPDLGSRRSALQLRAPWVLQGHGKTRIGSTIAGHPPCDTAFGTEVQNISAIRMPKHTGDQHPPPTVLPRGWRRRWGGRRCVTPRQTCPQPDGIGRNLRSKTRWFTGFCNSHQVSHFATLFIDARAEISVAESRLVYTRLKSSARTSGTPSPGPNIDALSLSISLGVSCAGVWLLERDEQGVGENRATARCHLPHHPHPKVEADESRACAHPHTIAMDAQVRRSLFRVVGFDNDPSAGSPTETLLRLLLPLNDKVQWTSRDVARSEPPTSPRSEHFTGPFNR